MHEFLPIILWGWFYRYRFLLWIRISAHSLLPNCLECNFGPSGVVVELVPIPLGSGSGSGSGISGLRGRGGGTAGGAGHRLSVRVWDWSSSRASARFGPCVRVASLIGPDAEVVVMETALRGWGGWSPFGPDTSGISLTLLLQSYNSE